MGSISTSPSSITLDFFLLKDRTSHVVLTTALRSQISRKKSWDGTPPSQPRGSAAPPRAGNVAGGGGRGGGHEGGARNERAKEMLRAQLEHSRLRARSACGYYETRGRPPSSLEGRSAITDKVASLMQRWVQGGGGGSRGDDATDDAEGGREGTDMDCQVRTRASAHTHALTLTRSGGEGADIDCQDHELTRHQTELLRARNLQRLNTFGVPRCDRDRERDRNRDSDSDSDRD